jgi:peptidoglycan/LPS O-acetylase OafA/YrhL
MTTHLKIVAVLYLIFGAFGLIGAMFVALAFGVAGGVVGANAQAHDAAIALPILGLTGTVLVVFLLVTSVPAIAAGIGLLKLRPWARILGIVVAVLYLIHIPLGTIVGIYALWVLFNGETERLLSSAPRVVT